MFSITGCFFPATNVSRNRYLCFSRDAQVANHIFDQCIMGILKKKTRILVTHHHDFLRSADKIIVMKNGRVFESGPADEVLRHLPEYEKDQPKTSDQERFPEKLGIHSEHPSVPPTPVTQEKEVVSEIVDEEQREYGTVNASVYKQYWRAVGSFWGCAVIISLVLMQGLWLGLLTVFRPSAPNYCIKRLAQRSLFRDFAKSPYVFLWRQLLTFQ